MRLNPNVKLKAINNPTAYGYARLEVILPEPSTELYQHFDFLINPASIKSVVQTEYNELAPAVASVPYRQYKFTKATEWDLTNVLLLSKDKTLGVLSLIEQLRSLTKPTLDKGINHPPVLSLQWGNRRIEPLVLVTSDFTESEWANGIPTKANGTIKLVEIPLEQVEDLLAYSEEVAKDNRTENDVNNPDEPIDMRPKDYTAGVRDAIAWLSNAVDTLTRDIRELVRKGRYLLKVKYDEDRQVDTVFIIDKERRIIEDFTPIGTLDDNGEFTPNSTITE